MESIRRAKAGLSWIRSLPLCVVRNESMFKLAKAASELGIVATLAHLEECTLKRCSCCAFLRSNWFSFAFVLKNVFLDIIFEI